MLEDALSDCVLRGDVASGDYITVDVDSAGRVVVLGAGAWASAAEAPGDMTDPWWDWVDVVTRGEPAGNTVLNTQREEALVPAGIA